MPCPKLAEGDVVRVTRVDGCGAPVSGADNAVISECFASVEMAPNVNTGTDIEMINMRGQTCGFKRACPDFRGFDVTANFYEASPELIEILTGNPVYFDYNGEPIGWDDGQVACASGFAMELWNSVIGDECEPGASEQYFYWLLGWVTNGVLGNVSIGAEGVNFTLTGATRDNSAWALGPWDVQAQDGTGTAGPMLVPFGGTAHRRAFLTTVAPPTAACGYTEVPTNNVS